MLAVGFQVVLSDDRLVTRQDSVCTTLHELEQLLLVLLVFTFQIIEEDASDTSSFASMHHMEIVVAPFLELRIVLGTMRIASFLQTAMEVGAVLFVQDVRCQIGAATEPRAQFVGLESRKYQN